MSLAQSVVASILSESDKHQAKKVLKIQLAIGELMQLDKGILVDSFRSLLEGPVLQGAELEVVDDRAVFTCQKCSAKWGMEEAKKQLRDVAPELLISEPDSKELPLHFLPELYPAFVHCPECGSSDIFLSDGGVIKVTRLVLEKGD
ncbi:MAG TPA: hydrogenase/urease maturation nickel metallochaperone HypA [Conexivisphaerales archaeon]|nr:hydrogenase/urease maturation nickel metallochaperone HypA [Conexivisphaerales archaeon]